MLKYTELLNQWFSHASKFAQEKACKYIAINQLQAFRDFLLRILPKNLVIAKNLRNFAPR